jgi:hypothetical protein
MSDPTPVLLGLSAIIDVLASFPVWRAAGLVLLGAVVAVDQVSVAQLQLAHPLVAGTLAGALLGRPLEGALAGALLGLLLAGHRPVGGVIPPDAGPGAVVAGAALARVGSAGAANPPGTADLIAAPLPGAPLAAALLLGLVVADLGRVTDAWTRRRNRNLVARAEAAATPEAVAAAVARAIGLAAVRGALMVALLLPAIGLVESWARRPPAGGPHAALVVAHVGGVGLAAGERLLGSRRRRGLLLAGIGALVAVILGTGP